MADDFHRFRKTLCRAVLRSHETIATFSLTLSSKKYSGRSVGGDMLEDLFAMQTALGRAIGIDPAATEPELRDTWVLNYARALQQEVAELVDCFPWKWWASYQQLDLQNARVEVVDILHFLICIAQTLGMGAQDLYAAFAKKHEVNLQRQRAGYAVKNPDDSRHI
ncbi:MAG: dUTPase [Puniceicoccales bacterium]|nr:dUTPase [Puniceicoccales bacterium]